MSLVFFLRYSEMYGFKIKVEIGEVKSATKTACGGRGNSCLGMEGPSFENQKRQPDSLRTTIVGPNKKH